jgi:hypothetical protein
MELTAWQDVPSWLILDANETPGGLASTDVTPEGFVLAPQPRPFPKACGALTVITALRRRWPCDFLSLQVF